MAEFYNLFLNIVTKEKILAVSIEYEKLLNRFYIWQRKSITWTFTSLES